MHPILFHLGHLTIPTFGALVACGLVLALLLSQHTARIGCANPGKIWDASLFAVLSAFVLSRVLLALTHLRLLLHDPARLLGLPSLTPVGILLSAVATAVFLRRRQASILTALDAWAPCATLLWGFLALGHFAAGSDPGMPARFGITMPGSGYAEHPIALYAAAMAAVLTGLLIFRLPRTRYMGETAALALMVSGVAQFLLSFLRLPDPVALFGLDSLQVVSLGGVVAGTFLFLARERDIIF